VTETRLSHTSVDRVAPSSAGNVYDVFTRCEHQFGRIQTIRDAQNPRPSFTPERQRGVAAGGSAVARGQGDKAGQNRDPLLTQKYRPGKRRKLSSLPDSGRGAKRSRFWCRAPTIGHGPPPVSDDNQYAVERLLERRNRGCVAEYLVKWERYGEKDHSLVKEADIYPDLIKDFGLTATTAFFRDQGLC
jgi:hypothetical protein